MLCKKTLHQGVAGTGITHSLQQNTRSACRLQMLLSLHSKLHMLPRQHNGLHMISMYISSTHKSRTP